MESAAREISKYSVEEYLGLTGSDTERTELINGEIVAFASPMFIHQDISTEITSELRRYIRKMGGKCRAYENSNVKLNDSTLIIPDVFVGCRPELFDKLKYNGAPDLAIEIVSSNRLHDFSTKLMLYQNNGTREYWIVDPKYSQTTVYFFEEHIEAEVYPFDKAIPVNIFKHNSDPLTINIAELIAPFLTEVQE